MSNGVMMDGKRTRKAKVVQLGKYDFKIILKQGLNRQIRRMVKKTGNRVKTLTRVRMGNIKIAGLKEGTWRYLTKGEVDGLNAP